MAKNFKFYIDHPGERDAGIWGYTETVDISVESGEVYEEQDFVEIMKGALKEFYDGAGVFTDDEYTKMIDAENKLFAEMED